MNVRRDGSRVVGKEDERRTDARAVHTPSSLTSPPRRAPPSSAPAPFAGLSPPPPYSLPHRRPAPPPLSTTSLASISPSCAPTPPLQIPCVPPTANYTYSTNHTLQPQHTGRLWYLYVHAPPPAHWRRCAAQLFPHALLLGWAAPSSGAGERGVAALDMRSCTGIVVLPPGAEDIVAAAAVAESEDMADMDALTILHILYADGIEARRG